MPLLVAVLLLGPGPWFGQSLLREQFVPHTTLVYSLGHGAEIDCPPSFQTGVLSYGPIDAQGYSRVTLAYDHRLMDGMLVADSLQRIEQILNGVLTDELKALSGIGSHRPPSAPA